LLEDPLIQLATNDISPDLAREDIEKLVKQKDLAVATLATKYANKETQFTDEEVRRTIASISDNHSYLRSNRDPCDAMLKLLTTNFHPDQQEKPWSLAIVAGRDGARLTHNHQMQYHYVHQSLMLWRYIAQDMFKLWSLAEQDLLGESNPYRLRNTGQGLNRMQSAPRIGRAMSDILGHCQHKVGSWVGSCAVHLGDTNVPNALMFIDKYNQVSRILGPILAALTEIDKMALKPDLLFYITNNFRDVRTLKMIIMTDFFQHGFDGSGADNFFDAGSCIDGRLTSAWNWCSKLSKKTYYNVFLMTGFNGFDGSW